MWKNERELILRYIDIIAEGIDAEAAESYIKNLSCELSQFNGILKRAKNWNTETKVLIWDCIKQISKLKKSPDVMEQATLVKIGDALSKGQSWGQLGPEGQVKNQVIYIIVSNLD
jgi:hypothetical protein